MSNNNNSLSTASSLQWIGDGSGDGNILDVNDDNKITIGSASAGTPYSVRLDYEGTSSSNNESPFSSNYCFRVHIEELNGHIALGIVQKKEFQPGWKTKGMFYNGNLTNGSAALNTGWGPYIQVGDTIGVMVMKSSNNVLRVLFYKNQQCLGTGFELANINSNTIFYPCLHVSGTVKVKVEYPSQLPTNIEPETTPPTGFTGDWELQEAYDGVNSIDVPTNFGPFLLRLTREPKDNNMIELGFKLGNRIGGKATIVSETSNSLTISCNPFMSTRMMPPPEIRSLEVLFGKTITTLTLEEDDNGTATNLSLSGPEIKSTWKRHIRVPTALTSY